MICQWYAVHFFYKLSAYSIEELIDKFRFKLFEIFDIVDHSQKVSLSNFELSGIFFY